MYSQFCPNCGASLGEARRFCPECGASLAESAAPAAATIRMDAPPPPPAAPAPRNSHLLWIILGGLGCLGAIMLLACVGLLLITLGSSIASAPDLPTAAPVATIAPPPTIPPAPTATGASGVIVYEDFSDPRESALTAEEDDISRSAFEDGAYIIEVKDSDTLAWSITDRSYGDIAIEAESTVAAGTEAVAAGLIFHYQDNQNFYLFSVSSDGYYALELLKGDEWITLIDWTESDAINARHNTLRVETKGDRITLKVNGERLEATQDDSLSDGDAGLAVSSFDASQVTIRFDNLLITRSP
ncbi:zinc-ribbon domain-containing protein [Chloroflexales bacterium ZM16-3]|nr:zinc-ribbon domain-containing protein [Chloroflexales bacterium ZM16-3]